MIVFLLITLTLLGATTVFLTLSQLATIRNIPPLDKRLKHISDERIAAWMAASDLFLDTELNERDWDRIAQTLVESGLSDRELDRLFFHEVQPVCRNNLFQVAGVWGGFDRDEIIELCSKRHYMPQSRLTMRFDFTFGDWQRVKARVRKMRNALEG